MDEYGPLVLRDTLWRDRARYLGVRKNTFDLRRAAALQDLERLTAHNACAAA